MSTVQKCLQAHSAYANASINIIIIIVIYDIYNIPND